MAAARDGAMVAFAGAVGRDALAERALSGMRAAGVELSRVAEVEAATGCAAVWLAMVVSLPRLGSQRM